MILSRRTLLAGLAVSGTGLPAFAQAAPEPQMVPIELVEDTLALPSAVRLGHRHGDVIMIEYFDYNCPWCRKSASDLPALLKAEPDLTYVLVNFAVLGIPSVTATKAALAYLQVYGPERYLPLHLALFRLTGAVDGERALKEIGRLGGDLKRVEEIANTDRTAQWMTDAFKIGDSLGFIATPSFLIATEAYVGGMSLAQKREAIARARG
ncbi:thioredoxin domain-containing protein [Microvirga makkahensis]|uniref:Thioredoxin domain-containing protein n=1 Tax=Microvirga makkahensis TaxID=1128670 RepID=A0A7X3MRG3_9HYPH|nr:thioredoxin domain-containing protein [Microvirga makkahensis]MXQ11892.1 thioredoxin domain-containing protein [Microvirga makkahensis]